MLGVIGLSRKLEEMGDDAIDETAIEELVHAAKGLGLWTGPEWQALEKKYT